MRRILWKRIGLMIVLEICYGAAEAYGKIPAPYWEINLGICYGFSAVAAALLGSVGGGVSAFVGEVLGELFGEGTVNPAMVAASLVAGIVAGGMYRKTAANGSFGKDKWKAFIIWTIAGQAAGFLVVYKAVSAASFAECFWRFFYNSICAVFVGGLILMALQEGNRNQSSDSSPSSSSKAL